MGPEDYDVLKTAISNQGQRLGYQEHTLQTVVDQSRDITSTLATLCFQQTQAVAATSAQQPVAAQQAPHASPVSEPHIPPHPSILVTPTPACVLVESPLTAHLLVCSAPCPFPAVHGPTLPSISSRVYPCPKVWRAFCRALAATVSLSSDFHPRLTARPSAPIRIWKQLFAVSPPGIPPPGAPNSPGLSMPTTLSSAATAK
ncbi:uncharacterized protein LOC115022817 isoform X1 [Cottoperca gobio]|uniref:Uncharacterized protein LOC115022679 isoform X1 n=1 Tax=Cottoperca gobio TaxID=56716 RepID=A0A6J2RHR2_COTGO|nr:uncharacterized protein LOC115022679 isoform X1 [Cottoperca gobio]XP_029309773.1 uncharacterized protein LOC115022817 isoform X1 [Cottoperca gobio]